MESPLRLLVTGKSGRMGQAVITCAHRDPLVTVAKTHDAGEPLSLEGIDAVIDFTTHGFTAELLDSALAAKMPLVIGTTGHPETMRERIRAASATLPIVYAPNFSVGVNTLFWLTRQATRILGPGFDLEVVEMHHRHKIDSPSGTARRLVEILCEETKVSYEDDTRHGRHGDVGPRTAKEIGVHALRGGDVVGDHTVVYAADGERVELTHKASSRETFANGAIRAAKWLAGKSAGLYDMQDVLGLH